MLHTLASMLSLGFIMHSIPCPLCTTTNTEVSGSVFTCVKCQVVANLEDVTHLRLDMFRNYSTPEERVKLELEIAKLFDVARKR
jgi:hypothetical protein